MFIKGYIRKQIHNSSHMENEVLVIEKFYEHKKDTFITFRCVQFSTKSWVYTRCREACFEAVELLEQWESHYLGVKVSL